MGDELRDRLAARLTGEFAGRPSTHVHVPPGWEQLVADLADRLDTVWPGWRLLQIKQKLGFLEVYLDDPPADVADTVHEAVRDATYEAARVCERCASRDDVTHGRIGGYYACLCAGCRHAGHRQLLTDAGLTDGDLARAGADGDPARIEVLAWAAGELADTLDPPGSAQWLRAPNQMLDGAVPLDVVAAGDVGRVRTAVNAYLDGIHL